MRSLVARSFIVAICLLALQLQAFADPPLQFRSQVDFTFRSGSASLACGFDVFVRIEGTGRATLFYDQDGRIVRENDSQPDLKVTVFAPATGLSSSFPMSGALHTIYTDGGALGSTGTAILTGLAQRYPGAGVDAGRTVFDTIVVDVTPEGIPVTDFELVSHTGPLLDMSLAAARCGAVR